MEKVPGDTPQFSCTREELQELMERRVQDASRYIQDRYGGVVGLCTKLRSSLSVGLDGDATDATARREAFGCNTIQTNPPKTVARLVAEALNDGMLILILVVAAIYLLGVQYEPQVGLCEAVTLLIIVILIVALTTFFNWKMEKDFQAPDKGRDESCCVTRRGETLDIRVENVLVGDICHFNNGDVLPADGVLVEGSSLEFDESSLTGSWRSVQKGHNDPICLSGSRVRRGSGKMLVTVVGMNTQSMSMLALAREAPRETIRIDLHAKDSVTDPLAHTVEMQPLREKSTQKKPSYSKERGCCYKDRSVLQTKLNKFAIQIGIAGSVVAVATVLILVIRFSVELMISGRPLDLYYIQYFIKFIIIGFMIFGAAVPKGVPLVVTLSLAYAAKKMRLENISVRNLYACEKMGNATVVCFGDTTAVTSERHEASHSSTKDSLSASSEEIPIKPEVKGVVKSCRRAGILVRAVTGNGIGTAKTISTNSGILEPNDNAIVMDSEEFNGPMRDGDRQEMFEKSWPQFGVLARSSPSDKCSLVHGIINNPVHPDGEVVAYVGGGFSDVPAMKEADIGISMGMGDARVANESSDIALSEHQLYGISKAVLWGRSVYDNISKFLQFQLTVNVVTVVLAFLGACVFRDAPLSNFQMYWVTLILTAFAALAYATEFPVRDLLKRPPHGRTTSLISPGMMKNIIGHSIYQLTVILLLLFVGEHLLHTDSGRSSSLYTPPSQHFTAIFNTFVLMNMFNEFNARKLQRQRNVFAGLEKHPTFIGIWTGTFILQILIVCFGGHLFKTSGLTTEQWLWCLFFGIGQLLWAQLLITIPDPQCRSKRSSASHAGDDRGGNAV